MHLDENSNEIKKFKFREVSFAAFFTKSENVRANFVEFSENLEEIGNGANTILGLLSF